MASETRDTERPPGQVLSADADTIPASSPPEDADAPPRPREPRYRLGAELGRGGMGRVVEAFDTQLGRTVALKEVLPGTSEGIARRFRREVQITAMLEHASIVPLYDAGVMADGRQFYVMRRVTGRPLEDLLRASRSFAERLAELPNLLAAIEAVAHAHRRGVIHRDLKPTNILVGDLGETVVIDWGLAKRLGERDITADGAPAPADALHPGDALHTQAGAVFGTPGFMAPEQARGETLGTEGDVFALGVTLYQLLAGRRPIKGTSATEVLSSTLAYDIEPIAKVCPQAPPELVAIVDKALAFDRKGRYRDAGELAADVRRFLTGQLVEAHRYTRRQRVARFARRHKGALAAVAAVAIAGTTTTGYYFRQVLAERDTATSAERRAEDGRRAADRANAALAERNDQLTVWRAESLLDGNPTAAAAALEQVRAGSPRLADARAAAQAAVVRGVVSAIQISSEPAVIDDLDFEARRLVHVTIDGALDVYDLDLRRSVLSRHVARGSRALWVGDGTELLVAAPGSPAQLIDAATGDTRRAALPAMDFAQASADGGTVLYTDAAHHVGLLDVARQTARLIDGATAGQAVLGADGSWLATADGTEVKVFDRTGAEIAHHEGSAYQVIEAGTRRLAVLDVSRIFLLTLDPHPVWQELPVRLRPNEHLLAVMFEGDQLDVFSTQRMLARWNGTALDDGVALVATPPPAAGSAGLALGSDDRLYVRDASSITSLPLPAFGDSPRLVARPGQSRICVVSPGQVLVLDLADVEPARVAIAAGETPAFVDDDHVILANTMPGAPWRWLDLATHRITPEANAPLGLQRLLDIDATTGRVLDAVAGTSPRGVDLVVLHEGDAEHLAAHVEVDDVPPPMFAMAILVPPDAVAYAVGPHVFVAKGGAKPADLGALDDDVVGLTRVAPHQLAVLSRRGELVRFDTSGAQLAHARIAPRGGLALGHDRDGRVLVGNDRDVLRWAQTLEELGRVDQPIEALFGVDGGVAVQLRDSALDLVAPGKPVRALFSSQASGAAISAGGTFAAAWIQGDQIQVVELPSLARWTVPIHDRAFTAPLDVAPSARLLLQPDGDSLALWHLPRAPADLGAWLADRTNATITAHGIAWPWQPTGP